MFADRESAITFLFMTAVVLYAFIRGRRVILNRFRKQK